MSTSNESRNAFFDNAKFLLIFLVVLGHAIRPLADQFDSMNALYLWIYSFHMPLMIFIAGYFSKNIHKKGQYQKLIATVLVPYLLFEFLYEVYQSFIYAPDSNNQLDLLSPYWLMWFMFSLFLWKTLLPYFLNLKYPLMISIALGLLIGFTDADKFLSFHKTIAFFPFFILGYFTSAELITKLQRKSVRTISALILIFSFITLYLMELHYLPFHMEIRKWLYFSTPYVELGKSVGVGVLYRFILYGICIVMSLSFLAVAPTKKTFFTHLGTRTLYVYLLHGFLIRTLFTLEIYEQVDSSWSILYAVLLSILITYILSTAWTLRLTKPLVQPRLHWLLGKPKHGSINIPST
ncbi:acyltransferase family protein [Mechercharimyces sp. CAU 1602]|uniref:acyltransferase family protein n=1 Tax=Mechercharimyces sp. CAU 1602 TaxID=2973933 RepID=UPI0021627469|nr:acyltransferase family protein [Mechercharimyces sp. CAU 1602]MCS1351785.1 acyltransferase family protein [Mechercharimyces sp. CAU 1602]